MAVALFAKTDVLGFERMEYELTPDAIELGLAAALPAVFEIGNDFGEFGRGERSRADMSDAQRVSFVGVRRVRDGEEKTA